MAAVESETVEKILFAQRVVDLAFQLHGISPRELPTDVLERSRIRFTETMIDAMTYILRDWHGILGRSLRELEVSNAPGKKGFVDYIRNETKRLFKSPDIHGEFLQHAAYVSTVAVHYFLEGVLDAPDYAVGLILECTPKDFREKDWDILAKIAYSFAVLRRGRKESV